MAAGAGSGLIPDLDGEPPRTPWGWLRGFGWFLLAWPLFGLLALGELGNFDWESILIAMLAPAGIGGALLLPLLAVALDTFGKVLKINIVLAAAAQNAKSQKYRTAQRHCQAHRPGRKTG